MIKFERGEPDSIRSAKISAWITEVAMPFVYWTVLLVLISLFIFVSDISFQEGIKRALLLWSLPLFAGSAVIVLGGIGIFLYFVGKNIWRFIKWCIHLIKRI